jgi:Zn-dependent protease
MGLGYLLFKHPLAFVLIAVPLLYSIILHELAHGWVALRMGDPTARQLGRLSLNPLKHLDPVGTIMLFVFGFGWAKPVPVNFSRLQDQSKAVVLVSSAGIVTNFLLAFAALFLQRLIVPLQGGILDTVLYFMAQINIMLAAFNLIPLPPLDGSKILLGLVPPQTQRTILRLEPYGFFIIIALLYFGILRPVIDLFRSIIVGLIGILLP